VSLYVTVSKITGSAVSLLFVFSSALSSVVSFYGKLTYNKTTAAKHIITARHIVNILFVSAMIFAELKTIFYILL